jgi:hypothetical protein
LLAVALVGLMRCPEERRPELKAVAMQRVATAAVNEYRKGLLMECLEAYLPLEEPHLAVFFALLQTPQYQEARQMAQTTLERGREEGVEIGQRALVRRLLEKRFGPLSPAVVQRLAALPLDRLLELGDALLDPSLTLKTLGLEEQPPSGNAT